MSSASKSVGNPRLKQLAGNRSLRQPVLDQADRLLKTRTG